MTTDPKTLTEVFQGVTQANSRGVNFIEGEHDETRIEYPALSCRALGLLGHFQRAGLGSGDELILFTQSNECFIDAFWACILGGIIPVPVAVGNTADHRNKLLAIFGALDSPHLYTEETLLHRLRRHGVSTGQEQAVSRLEAVTLKVNDVGSIDSQGSIYAAEPDDIAFVQFSSGSTSAPKGVVLTHDNVLTNIQAISEGYESRDGDVALSWMPLTHDMGLIGFHLCMMAEGHEHHIMDTQVFVRRPLLWLQKAEEKGATVLCSPNFGYRHFLKVFERRGMDLLDLSRVRVVFNGAEPISRKLAESFMQALAPHGLRPGTMFPVYGLAEASLGVTFPPTGRELRHITAHRHDLAVGRHWRAADTSSPDAVDFVLLGTPLRDCELRVCNEQDEPLPQDQVGHVQIRGGNVTSRYYDDPEDRRGTFTAGGWLRTGDLGLIHDGELVITGRAKDIIFVNGQNYYPHDLEQVAQQLDEVEMGKVVAAGVTGERSGTDDLLLFLLHRGDVESFIPLGRLLRAHINERTGLEVHQVIPVDQIPKTTSGKIQRHRLATAYLDGQFQEMVTALKRLDQAASGEPDAGQGLEQVLKAICKEVVVDRPIELDDNLFEIGISSLALAQIHARVDELYPDAVDIADVFEYPSIRELAAFMENKTRADHPA